MTTLTIYLTPANPALRHALLAGAWVFFPLLAGLATAWLAKKEWEDIQRRNGVLARLFRRFRRPNPMSADERLWYLTSIGDLMEGLSQVEAHYAATPRSDRETHEAIYQRRMVLMERLFRMKEAYKARRAAENLPPPQTGADD